MSAVFEPPEKWRRVFCWLLLSSLALLLSSCGHNGRKPVYPVRGQVFDRNHKPAVGALVIFHPADAGDTGPSKPLAYVEEDGSFALTTYDQGDGAAVGEYVATIEWRPRSTNPFDPGKQGGDRLQGRYSKPQNSLFRFTVAKQADNVLPPIHLP